MRLFRNNAAFETRNYLIYITFFLLFFSCILIYDVSSISSFNTYNNPYHFTVNQIIWVIVAILLFFIIQKIKLEFFKKYIYHLYIFSIILAILTIIPSPFKKEVLGASRWVVFNPQEIFPKIFMLGEITIQPSELLKLSLCFVFSLILTSKSINKNQNRPVYVVLLYSFFTSVIFLIQPSFKDVFINLCMVFTSIFFWGFPLKNIFKLLLPIFIIVLFSIYISGYRLDRLKTFMGGGDTSNSAYHQNQLKIALGSGGIFGLGFGKSIQKHEYVPEAETDSIFAIFSEEFGFVGSSVLLIIFYIYFVLIYKSIFLLKEPFEKFFALNVLVWYGIQSFLNLGSITGVIPLTGVPLPLISYGGSSLIFFTGAIGVLCNMLKNTNKLNLSRYN